MNIPNIVFHLGCDPEAFFETPNGAIVGAEKVIGEKGISTDIKLLGRGNGMHKQTIIMDGVQVELNPRPESCRANLGVEIAACFRALKAHLDKMNDGTKVSFRSVVEVDKDELASLSDKARILGCAPSKNHYDKEASISIDMMASRVRSAGGHIHCGFKKYLTLMMNHREELTPMMDIIVGNTCVMVDRDPMAAERRKTYGRAGEFRLPDHGYEYRTLSNFWLRSYPLMSMVMGFARNAVAVLNTSIPPVKYVSNDPYYVYVDKSWNAPARLMELVNLEAVREAINTNNYDLARENFQGVKTFIRETSANAPFSWCTGLVHNLLDEFEFFTEVVKEKGLEFWFPEDPIEHWCAIMDGHGNGWEQFLVSKVSPALYVKNAQLRREEKMILNAGVKEVL